MERYYDSSWQRTMFCGQARLEDSGRETVLNGWLRCRRDLGGIIFIELWDKTGVTQVVFNPELNAKAHKRASSLRSEYVLAVKGTIRKRPEGTENPELATGSVELLVDDFIVLSPSKLIPFEIDNADSVNEDLRLKYRYLDLRRETMQKNLMTRHRVTRYTRNYFGDNGFMEIETPMLTKSTPEGARDYLVPSRVNPGKFYALPQSPQLFKQLLMVSGCDRYMQIVKCFRDEDLRADRQPEFTQIDCEMSFIEQNDVLEVFEGLARFLFSEMKGVTFDQPFLRMPYTEAIMFYGSDKPDIRFDMRFAELKEVTEAGLFTVFDNAPYIGGIAAKGCATYTRKQLDELTDFVKRPQIGASGMVYVRCEADGSYKSSVDKFYGQEQLKRWAEALSAQPGDLLLILSGEVAKTRKALCELRLEMGNRLGLRDKNTFAPLWVVDFPMFEWDEETNRFFAMHHPFTSPKPEDIALLDSDPGQVRANAYDMVINGIELGGGSIRIFDSQLQAKAFEVMGFSKEQAERQFGFLMGAFKYGAPPHGGLAFGLDRFVSLFAGLDSIRDCIAFPKNNAGRDVMINAPSRIDQTQLDELYLDLKQPLK